MDTEDKPKEVILPSLEDAHKKVLEIANRIKKTKANKDYICPKNGCFACKPYKAILNKEAQFIGSNSYQDIYVL